MGKGLATNPLESSPMIVAVRDGVSTGVGCFDKIGRERISALAVWTINVK